MAGTVREQVVSECTPDDRAVLATAFVTPHAVARYQTKVAQGHPNQVVQDITAGLRDRAVTVRDRTGLHDRRVDVTVETPTARWVARIIANQNPNGSALVVETILDHPDNWDVHPHPGGPGLWLTSIALNRTEPWVRDAATDICTMHRRVLDLVEDHPEMGDARVLWAAPHRGMLVIRSASPVTTTPAGFATAVMHRPWQAPDCPGTWSMTAVINPGKNHKSEGSSRRAGKGKGRSMTLHKTVDEVTVWLERKLDAGVRDLQIVDARVDRGRRPAGARPVTERKLRVVCLVDVTDPAPVAAAAAAGIGRGKAWGCGLSLWQHKP